MELTLIEKKWNSCKILARCIARSCKRMHCSCRNLTRSCKKRFILTSFFEILMFLTRLLQELLPMFLSHKMYHILFKTLCFLLKNCSKNLAVDSEPSILVEKTTRVILSKRTRYSTIGLNCFVLYFYSYKLNHYKTHEFKKFLIPGAFKHIRLQNTFNRCKVHQILPLMVDYVCFLVKCINYQNVMCIQKIYCLQDLARFLQECHCIQESCKNWIFYENLARTS